MIYLKQSTAVDVMLGPFIDDTDGKTTEEALTLAQADLQLSKNGGAAAQKNDATAGTHRYGGNYMIDLNTTDTNTLGHMRIMCKESGALPVIADFMIVTANWYDTMFSTDQLDVNVTNVAGTAQTANDNGADINAILVGTADMQPRVVAIEVDTGTTLDGKIDTIDTNVDLVLVDTGTTIPGTITTVQNDLDILTGADGAILNTTQANYAPNVVVPDAAGVAATPAEVATALTDIHLDHLLAVDYDPAAKPGVATALLNELIESDAGVSRYTANALEQAPSGTGGDATEAKQDTIIANLAIVDTNVDQIETAVITNAAGVDIAADIIAVKAETANILTDTDTTIPGLIAALNDITAADIWTAASARIDDYGTLLEKVADFWFNEKTVTDSTGAVVLRNEGDLADLASWGITDNATITVSTEVSWV